MSDRTVVQLPIYTSPEKRERIHNHARRRGYKVTADYIRHLIERDMAESGEPIDLDVDRGGDRTQPRQQHTA